MILGQLRKEIAKLDDLPASCVVMSTVEDVAGEYVNQDVEPTLRTFDHEDDVYVIITTRVQ